MKTAVVDASVAVKWLLRQPKSDRAYAAIKRFKLIAPSLILAEVGNALWKYRRADMMPVEAVDAALDGFESSFFESVPIDEATTAHALKIAMDLDHPIYDCYYLSLSKRYDIPLITDDSKLARRASDAGFHIIELALSNELDADH